MNHIIKSKYLAIEKADYPQYVIKANADDILAIAETFHKTIEKYPDYSEATKLDPDYIGCKDNMDDSYRDAIYHYGIKLVREYSAMGFPMQISYSDETKLEDYIGPIGVVMIIPDEDGITIIFQSITECSVLSDFTIANKIIFGTNGRAYRLDITNLYLIPEWVKRITDAISNFTHWS